MSAKSVDALRTAVLTARETSVFILGDQGVGKHNIQLLLERSFDIFFDFINGYLTERLKIDAKKIASFAIERAADFDVPFSPDKRVVLIVVYDICNEKSSFNALSTCKHHNDSYRARSKDITLCLVGNKIDLEFWRRIDVQSGRVNAVSGGAKFVEVSAHSGQHIDDLLDVVLQVCLPGMNANAVKGLLDSVCKDSEVSHITAIAGAIKEELSKHSRILDDLETGARQQSAVKPKSEKRKKGFSQSATYGPPTPLPPPAPPNVSLSRSAPGAPPAPPLQYSAPPPPLQYSAPQAAAPPFLPALEAEDLLGGLELKSYSRKEQANIIEIEMTEDSLDYCEDAEDQYLEESTSAALPQISRLPDRSGAPGAVLERRKIAEPRKESKSLIKPSPKPNKNDYFSDSDNRAGEGSVKNVEREIAEVRNVMQDNVDKMIDRSDKLDLLSDNYERANEIMLEAEDTQMQSGSFKRNASKLKHRMSCCYRSCLCLIFCPFNSVIALVDQMKGLFSKKSLFDNVLADTENAFQTLAKCLAFLNDVPSKKWTLLQNLFFGYFLSMTCLLSSFMLVVSSAITLILPSFFTLLIVRTSTIEKESKAFGIRQEVIRVEKNEESLIRWLRIILRSAPMTFYLLVLPFLLVYYVFPDASERVLTICLVMYLSGVILLQVLGSIRSYYSWKSRDMKPPAPPSMYVSVPGVPSNKSCFSCCWSTKAGKEMHLERGPIPVPPNTFDFMKPTNWIELVSLTLEFIQMASFALQRDPYASSNKDEDAPTFFPTASPSVGITVNSAGDDDEIAFWGKDLFETVYINVPVESDIQLALMWGSVGLVGLLLLLFSVQFLSELKLYGQLMKKVEDKDKAKDSFFFSFTGAIVYGHGIPKNISDRMRLVVGLLSDGLFLVISVQLLQVFACDYTESERPTLRLDDSMVCWEGHHAVLATASLVSYAFYVPLSIMITPMLLEAPRQEDETGGHVTYLKLYLMSINVTKSIMLLVAVLGPQQVSTAVISSIVASFLLGTLTYAWFKSQDLLKSHYSAELQPCNIAFINFWKAASYTAAVTSAVAVVVAHSMQESVFSPQALTDSLIVAWSVIVATFVILYYRYYKQHFERQALVKELIKYPFVIRDARETDGKSVAQLSSPDILFRAGSLFEKGYKIPGFQISPWKDDVIRRKSPPAEEYGPESLSGVVIRSQIRKAQHINSSII